MYADQCIPLNRSAARRGALLLIALASFLVAGCQSSAPTPPEQAENLRQVEYFLILNRLQVVGSATDVSEETIRDWGRLNDQALILAVGSGRQVLVTLREPCVNLEQARAIGFDRSNSYVVLDPMGRGFDIRENFGGYLSPGDKLILAHSAQELDSIRWQPDGPGFGQLGQCTVAQLLYLEPFPEPEEESEEVD